MCSVHRKKIFLNVLSFLLILAAGMPYSDCQVSFKEFMYFTKSTVKQIKTMTLKCQTIKEQTKSSAQNENKTNKEA